jgi:hypothetical protein
MSYSQFYTYLFLLLLFCTGIALFIIDIKIDFFGIALIWWLLNTTLIFAWGKSLSNSPSKYAFQSVISTASMVNLFAVPTILFLYKKINGSISRTQILYFILTYCIFTVYKVYFLSRLGHHKTIK